MYSYGLRCGYHPSNSRGCSSCRRCGPSNRGCGCGRAFFLLVVIAQGLAECVSTDSTSQSTCRDSMTSKLREWKKLTECKATSRSKSARRLLLWNMIHDDWLSGLLLVSTRMTLVARLWLISGLWLWVGRILWRLCGLALLVRRRGLVIALRWWMLSAVTQLRSIVVRRWRRRRCCRSLSRSGPTSSRLTARLLLLLGGNNWRVQHANREHHNKNLQ